MGKTSKKKWIDQVLEKAAPSSDGKSFLMFDVGGGDSPSVVSAQDLLSQPNMDTIANDDADGLLGVFDFATGFRVDMFSIELPLVNLDTREEGMVNIPIMCYAMGKEACFGVAMDKLLAASKAPNTTHPLLHELVREIANAMGQPGVPPPQARMLYKLVYGFMEVADSHGELQQTLSLPMPQPILDVAKQVAAKSRSGKE